MAHLIECSECKKQLQVPDELLGKKVQCPECQHTFTAALPGEGGTVTASPAKKTGPPGINLPTKRPAWDKKKADADDDDDGYDVKKTKKRRNDEEDDDEDDDDDRPSRRRKKRSSRGGNFTPHRGAMILAFGIIALVSGLGIIFGPIAWIMGNNDLRDMRDGRMDPEGEGMTRVGQVLGIIATILSIVAVILPLGLFGFFCCVGILGAAGNANNPNFNRRR